MRLNLKGLSDKQLTDLFDRVARIDNQHLAKRIVYRLAFKHYESFEVQLRYLGKRAVKRKDYPSFNMVAKLWEGRD